MIQRSGSPRPKPATRKSRRSRQVRIVSGRVTDEERGFAPAAGDPVLTTPVERPRPAILPLAFTAIMCLLIGYAIRDAMGGRTGGPAAVPSAENAKTTATPAPAKSSTDAQQPGRAYSEQAVAPPAAAAPQASGEAPPVPGDAPAAETSSRAAKAPAAASSARLTVLSNAVACRRHGQWKVARTNAASRSMRCRSAPIPCASCSQGLPRRTKTSR